jgi:hypothetical protein
MCHYFSMTHAIIARFVPGANRAVMFIGTYYSLNSMFATGVLCLPKRVSTHNFLHRLDKLKSGGRAWLFIYPINADRRADYSDFLKRFQEDPHSISSAEAAQRYQELVSHAPPELAAEANQHILGFLSQNDRDVLADNINGSQQPIGMLDNLLSRDSILNSPLGKMVLSAAVAYLANRMLGQPQSQVDPRAPSGGLGDLLASFLGGGAPGSQSPAGGLGDILGALMGGREQAGNQSPAGGLGDILGALMGGAPGDTPEPAPEPPPPIRTHRKP